MGDTGGNRTPATDTPQRGSRRLEIHCLPDGSNLAFIRYDHPGVADLFIVSMQGGEPPDELEQWPASGSRLDARWKGSDLLERATLANFREHHAP